MMQQKSRVGVGGLFAAGLLVLAAATFWPRLAHSRSAQPGVRYEYAELQIRGNDAIFQTSERTIYLEGPDTNNPQEAENEPSIRVFREVAALIHLTTVGQSGWDLVTKWTEGGRDVFLMQRAR